MFVVILILAAAPAMAGTEVYLLGGQSNMLGLGGTGYGDIAPPAPYSSAQGNVFIWNATTGAWSNLQNGFGFPATASGSAFGPELSLGYQLHAADPTDNIYLIKYAVGGTNLASDWNPNGTGACFNAFKSEVNTAMQNLTTAKLSPTIAGMFWMQGETDASDQANAQAYQTNLTNFIGDVRSDFNTPNMPFVLGRIINFYYDTTPPGGNALVRNAQVTVANTVPNCSWVSTDSLELNPTETGHFGTQGQLDLGLSMANRLTALTTSAPSNAKTLTISDTTFNTANWNAPALVKYTGNGLTATNTVSQVNLGSGKTAMDVTSSWSTSSGVEVGVINKTGFSLAKTGAVNSLSYSIEEECPASKYDLFCRMIVEQNGKYYAALTVQRGYTSPGQGKGYATFSDTDLLAADFCQITSDGILGDRDTTSHPDFSTAGGDLYFGVETYGGASVGMTYVSQFDSFSVTLNYSPPVPEPSSIVLLMSATVGLGIYVWRKGKRKA